MPKKYYWLKLKSDFFTSRAMKKLRRIAGGDTYTIIYLKLQLLSLKDEGKLFFEGVEPTFYEEMALALDEDAENVRVTLVFLESMGLIEKTNDQEYMLSEVPYLIGGEGESAERMRRHRGKRASLCDGNVTECDGIVTKSDTEIEIDIEKDKDTEKETDTKPAPEEKHIYGEYSHVRLKDTEMEKLLGEYGKEITTACITYLDEYIEMKGYKAKNHYLCIKKWVVDAVKEKKTKQDNRQSTKAQELDDFYTMAANWAEKKGEIK